MSTNAIVTSDRIVLTRVSNASPRSALPPAEVETRLLAALCDLDAARKNAVIWFGEILSRKLYLEFGCSSIHHYAHERLGFSRARSAYFLRLCRSFEALPTLKESVASGAVPWTKAREVVKVATPETDRFWVDQARTTGRRELERRVAAMQGAARARRRAPGQRELLVAGGNPVGSAEATDAAMSAESGFASWQVPQAVEIEIPVTVSFQLTPEQYARYEAILERARKAGARGSREELFLAAWEMLTRVGAAQRVGGRPQSEGPRSGGPFGEDDPRPAKRCEHARRHRAMPRGDSAPRYQIVIRQCEDCGRADIATGRGVKPVAPKTLETALCDARVHRKGEKNRATIPPSMRREVLARDGHRCRTAGYGSVRFLDVHHVIPRDGGGSNDAENLITLCAACHRMIHERGKTAVAWPTRRCAAERHMQEDHPGDRGDRDRK